MSFCRWKGCVLELHTPEREGEIVFPKCLDDSPVLSRDGRYAAVCGEEVYIHDCNETQTVYLKKKFVHYFCFDQNNRFYYTDHNDICVLNLETMQDDLLYSVGRTPNNPQNIAVSPYGTYVSFCRYKGDNLWLYLVDTETKELIDYRISVWYYAWLDEEHIVWTKNSGLKILNVKTGETKLILRDHKKLIKQGFGELFEQFRDLDGSLSLFVNLDFRRVLNGRIYFTLEVDNFNPKRQHLGLWSVGADDYTPQFHYAFPTDFRKAIHKYLDHNGTLVWASNSWHIFDGTTEKILPNDWLWVKSF